MTRVIIIGGYAPSLITFRGDLLKSMVLSGHKVLACVPDASEEIVETLRSLGVDYCNVPVSRTGLNPLEDIRTFFALFRLFKKERPDVVLSYTIKPVIYGSLAAKFASVPSIFSMITGLGNAFVASGFKARLIRLLVSFLYRMGLVVNKQIFFQNPDDHIPNHAGNDAIILSSDFRNTFQT